MAQRQGVAHRRGAKDTYEVPMQPVTPDLDKLKSGMKATWMAGDFGQVANYTAEAAEQFVEQLAIQPGSRVLDVACGTGNTAVPAARAGAVVTGVDIASNLLEQAKKRATAAGLNIQFHEGDAEDLPFPDNTFDVVITMFGAMFAPRPDRVASELLRVCKSGGQIAMANWTPRGFIGQQFQLMARSVPPPPGIPAPALWGDEEVVRQRLSNGFSGLNLTHRTVQFHYPFAPKEVVRFFRQYFGPTQTAFSRLDETGQASLAAQLEAHWKEHNLAQDGTTMIKGEYLEVRAGKA
jgi:ubiquinone/menaquinone biosynthesis C-methylase UbiE